MAPKTAAEMAAFKAQFVADIRTIEARAAAAYPAVNATMLDRGQPLVAPAPISNERPVGSVASYDLGFAKRLPPEAKSILTNLANEAYEAKTVSLSLHNRRLDLRETVGAAKARLNEITANRAGYRSGVEASIAQQREFLAECEADLALVEDRSKHVNATAATLGRLVESSRSLVNRIDRSTPITLYAGPSPQLRKNETASDAVEARRRRLRELEADFNRITVAPKLAADVKAQEIARIELLAKQGAPNALAAIEQGLPIIWPTTSADLIGQIGSATVIDFLAVIAHLNRDAMIAAVTREIDLMADDENALSDGDRDKQLKQIKRDILATSREEVAFVGMANTQGANILFRGDTDPRALLNLGDDMPAPRND
ncbi:hypothetical protein [Bradyrhizobium sp. AZCC 2289]|uniref:hypothetical protein n=1 Tax=Bradyrhizobium sp. AZCC 2289 TaxID=3117026 RepID=UPI002FF111E9